MLPVIGALSLACATTPPGVVGGEADLAERVIKVVNGFAGRTELSWPEHAVEMGDPAILMKIKQAKLAQDDRQIERTVFDSYCKGKTPIREVRKRVTFVVPRFDGVPLDQATSMRKTMIDAVKSYLQEELFFRLTDAYDAKDSSPEIDGVGWIPVLPGRSRTELIAFFRGARPTGSSPIDINDAGGNLGRLMIVILPGSDEILLVPDVIERLAYRLHQGKSVKLGQPGQLGCDWCNAANGHWFQGALRVATLDPEPVEVDGRRQHLLLAAYLPEFSELRRFTFYVGSKEEYLRVFPRPVAGVEPINAVWSATGAIERSAAAWKNFSAAKSTLREIASEHPGQLQYEVAVDMRPFCRFGRALSDLKSE